MGKGQFDRMSDKLDDIFNLPSDVSDDIFNFYIDSYIDITKEYKERVKYSGTKRARETNFKSKHDKIAVKISTKKRESARNTTKQNINKNIHEAEKWKN